MGKLNTVLNVAVKQLQNGAIGSDEATAYFCGVVNALRMYGMKASMLQTTLSDYYGIDASLDVQLGVFGIQKAALNYRTLPTYNIDLGNGVHYVKHYEAHRKTIKGMPLMVHYRINDGIYKTNDEYDWETGKLTDALKAFKHEVVGERIPVLVIEAQLIPLQARPDLVARLQGNFSFYFKDKPKTQYAHIIQFSYDRKRDEITFKVDGKQYTVICPPDAFDDYPYCFVELTKKKPTLIYADSITGEWLQDELQARERVFIKSGLANWSR